MGGLYYHTDPGADKGHSGVLPLAYGHQDPEQPTSHLVQMLCTQATQLNGWGHRLTHQPAALRAPVLTVVPGPCPVDQRAQDLALQASTATRGPPEPCSLRLWRLTLPTGRQTPGQRLPHNCSLSFQDPACLPIPGPQAHPPVIQHQLQDILDSSSTALGSSPTHQQANTTLGNPSWSLQPCQ